MASVSNRQSTEKTDSPLAAVEVCVRRRRWRRRRGPSGAPSGGEEVSHVVGQQLPGHAAHGARQQGRQHAVRVLVVREAQLVEVDCGPRTGCLVRTRTRGVGDRPSPRRGVLTGEGQADGHVGEVAVRRVAHEGHRQRGADDQRRPRRQGQSTVVGDPQQPLLARQRRLLRGLGRAGGTGLPQGQQQKQQQVPSGDREARVNSAVLSYTTMKNKNL